jgi:hypothetical protein
MFMFILSRLIYTVGTGKKRSLSESRGDHLGGAKTSKIHSGGPEGVQYNRLITLEGCSVIGVLLYISFEDRKELQSSISQGILYYFI